MGRLTVLLLVALAGGLLVVELTMRPSATERYTFIAIFGGIAFLAWASTPLLLRVARASKRFRDALTVAASAAVVVSGTVIAVAAAGMFVSDHDLRLTLAAIATGSLVAIAQLRAIAGGLADDLSTVGSTVDRMMKGDLAARSSLDRPDELGDLARSIDALGDRLRTLEEERAANEQVRQELLTNIGHDLRTPLSSMQVAVEAVQDGMAPDPDAYMASIGRDIRHLTQLVDDLFLISRLDSGDVTFSSEPLDLAELADETIEALQPLADHRGIQLELDADGAGSCTGDATAAGRSLRNLVANALRHAETEVRVHVRGDATGASAIVRDDGIGFPDELRAIAFDRFVRGDESRSRDGSGAGLGLAIASRLVDGLNGEITILEGPGGAVRVWLPWSSQSS